MINIVWDEPFLKILKKWKKKHPDLIAKTLKRKLKLSKPSEKETTKVG